MSATVTLATERRTACGKSATLALRKQGRVPAVLYGGGGAAAAISFDAKEMVDHLRNHSLNGIVALNIDGTSHQAVIKELDVHPVTRRLRHLDLLEVSADRKVILMVPLKVEGGDPVGVRHGGILQVVRDEVKVSCLPGEIPEHLSVDLSELDSDQSFTAAELNTDLSLLIPPETVLFKILSPRVAKASEMEVEEAGEEGAPEEEGGEE